MAARANAFDNFLPRIAALTKANVRAFDGRFVWDYCVIEIERKPGNTSFQPQCIQGLHTNRASMLRVNGCVEILPDDFEFLTRCDDLRAWQTKMRVAD